MWIGFGGLRRGRLLISSVVAVIIGRQGGRVEVDVVVVVGL